MTDLRDRSLFLLHCHLTVVVIVQTRKRHLATVNRDFFIVT